MLKLFRQRFWQPPRAHGEIDEERSVGFIELFYDLVFVVVIARAAHHFAGHLAWHGVLEFAIIFGLIWLAWLNGSVYQDLHGREDGRSRTFIFLQMGILAILGVFTADAATETGQGFALTYTALLLLLTWMWYTVRRQDSEEYMAITARYLLGMVVSVVVMGASAFASDAVRLTIWGGFVVAWLVMMLALEDWRGEVSMRPTDSTVERFGLFVIIVLGEVVVGVVTGLSEATPDFRTIATGMIGLSVGFGIWWTYFDFVGRRMPRDRTYMRWTLSHLPVVMAIAAAGAAMVSLVESAAETSAPDNASWVLSGSVAVALLALTYTMTTLADWDRLPSIYQPLKGAMAIGAVTALLVGWWGPAPWLLALSLLLVLSLVWWVAVVAWLRLPDPSEARPNADRLSR